MYRITRVKYYDYDDGVIVTRLSTEAQDPYEWIEGFRRRQLKKGHRIGYVDVLAKEREAFKGGTNLTPSPEHVRDYKVQHPELSITDIARKLGIERHKVLIYLN